MGTIFTPYPGDMAGVETGKDSISGPWLLGNDYEN
jgi:hypothetical protein